MSELRLDLADIDYDALVELGRARIPTLAPRWTDHNAHDPGIMLIELLAWNAEAQIYSLGRMRTDEREAYAALVGVERQGPQPARGLVWPTDFVDPGAVIEPEANVTASKPDTPVFWSTHRVLLTAAKLARVRSISAKGLEVDQTAANKRPGLEFDPFGAAQPGDKLMLDLACEDGRELVPANSHAPRDAALSLGVRVTRAENAVTDALAPVVHGSLVLPDGRRFPLATVADSSRGFMTTGVLLLALSALPDEKITHCTIEISADARGFARPPRVERIALNVLPVTQNQRVVAESHVATGLPGLSLQLGVSGLRFGGDAKPRQVLVAAEGTTIEWRAVRSLASSEPGAREYEIDARRGAIRFGNGVNGAIPPSGATIFVTYEACAGRAGNLVQGQTWSVRGVVGALGRNLDAFVGGADSQDPGELRRTARAQSRKSRALVTSADLENAARELPYLQVARACSLTPKNRLAAGLRVLVVMRARQPQGSVPRPQAAAAPVHESANWLAVIHRSLEPRIPMGERLLVVAPRYVRVRVNVRAIVARLNDPNDVQRAIRAELTKRLALLPAQRGDAIWPFGRNVTRLDVVGWLRNLQGVEHIAECQLLQGEDETPVEYVEVARLGLPELDLAPSRIQAQRRAGGRVP